MNSIDTALRLTAFASILVALLLFYLMKHRNSTAISFILFFFICFTFILTKWHLKLDLGTYDAELYQSIASNISTQLHLDFFGNLPHIFIGYSAYAVPLGFLYFVFGNSELVGQLFSTLLGLGVLYNLYHLALICFNRQVANLTALGMALYPYGWILGTTLNRDIAIAFFITWLFRVLAEAQDCHCTSSRTCRYAIGLGCILYLTLLRPPLLLLCGLTLLIYLLIQKRGFSISSNVFKSLKILVFSMIIAAIAISIFFAKDHLSSFRLTGQAIQLTSIDNLNHRLESSEEAGSAYMAGTRYTSTKDILSVMPLATVYFMYSPFPWQVRSPKQALGLVDSILLLIITYFFLKGVKTFYRRRRKFAVALLTFLILGFCTSSLLQSNVGAAMRHRTMFFFLMVPIAAYGFLRSTKHTMLT
jgi:membrane protein CcdC involved in cytochrome C biogenesis